MPFVKISVGRKLSDNEYTAVNDVVSQNITIIPGKTVAATMVQIEDGRRMYKDASRRVCIFIEVRLYGSTTHEAKSALTEKLTGDLSVMLDVPLSDIYLNIVEMENWGANGAWK